jgi:hypothetical protein
VQFELPSGSAHPEVDQPTFIARLGHQQQRLLPLLLKHGVRITASPLYYLASNPQLALIGGAEHKMGLVLDPCVHLRQVPYKDRAKSFRGLAWGESPDGFDPESDEISADELAALAIEPLEAQRRRGATLLLTSAHMVGGVGTRGLELNLKLAEIGIAHFRREGLKEPPENALNEMPRELYATIAVRVEALRTAESRSALCEAYRDQMVAGYWVKIEGFSEAGRLGDMTAAGAFLAGLREHGKPIVCDQPGLLHLGLLADDFAVALGIAEGERFTFPKNWAKETAGRERKGRVPSAYHPKFLHSFRPGFVGITRAFAHTPCDCGLHERGRAPDAKTIPGHTAVVRCQQASEALAGDREDRREWLGAVCAMAAHAGRDAGVDFTLGVVFEALFDGLDRREQQELKASER